MDSAAGGGAEVLALSSLVAHGSVGLRAAAFALERRGHAVWQVPTVLMPWHPGRGRSTRLATDPAAFAAMLSEIADAPGANGIAAVLTGYFADAGQVAAAADAVDRLRTRRPSLLVCVDPVTGDTRGPYVPAAVVEAIRTLLVPRADILTPNRPELGILAGTAPSTVDEAVDLARSLGARETVVTSLADGGEDRTGAVLVGTDGVFRATHEAVAGAPHGTGDLFAALFLADRLARRPAAAALSRSLAATLALVRRAVAAGSPDLPLAAGQQAIASPPEEAIALAGDAPRPDGARVAGVDGCRSGWIAVLVNAAGPLAPEMVHAASFRALVDRVPPPAIVAVDMPIGLPDRIEGAGRAAEQAVRPLLGARQSSVFSIPARAAVMARSYEAACTAALAASTPPRKVSRQSFMIFPKIREIDGLIDAVAAERVFEVHPEVAFWRLNGERPMALPKKVRSQPSGPGIEERIGLLVRHGFDRAFFEGRRPTGCGLDDLVDAAVNALMARRIHAGEARPFPDPPDRDARGLPIAIWA